MEGSRTKINKFNSNNLKHTHTKKPEPPQQNQDAKTKNINKTHCAAV